MCTSLFWSIFRDDAYNMLSSNAYFTPSNKTPMPGKAAVFKLECDWDQFDKDPAGNLVRSLEFSTETEDSFFSRVEFLGYRSGEIVFRAKFKKSDEKLIENFFHDNDVGPDCIDFSAGFCSPKRFIDKVNFLHLLLKNNEFLKDKSELMEALIIYDNWYKATPFKPGQTI